MANVVDTGDRYEFRVEFRDKLGVLADPSTVTLNIEKADGTLLGPFTFAGGGVTRESTGVYFREETLTQTGVWTAEWITTGVPTQVEYERVVTRESQLTGEDDYTLDTRALVTLEDAYGYCDVPLSDLDARDDLIRLVNTASHSIHRVAEREFKPWGSNPQTRSFEVVPNWPGRRASEAPLDVRVGDLTSFTAISVDTTALDAGALALVVGIPRNRPAWKPMNRLRLANAVALGPGSVVAVTGNFGFPQVPEDVREACLRQVKWWQSRDIEKSSETFSVEEPSLVAQTPEGDRSLIRSVYDVARSYRLVGLSRLS